MSAGDPDDAKWSFSVASPYARKIATRIKNNPKKTGVLLAVFGIFFSILSVYSALAVFPDILVDIVSALIAYIYIERLGKVKGKATAGTTASAEISGE
jgi:hypothetical protein